MQIYAHKVMIDADRWMIDADKVIIDADMVMMNADEVMIDADKGMIDARRDEHLYQRIGCCVRISLEIGPKQYKMPTEPTSKTQASSQPSRDTNNERQSFFVSHMMIRERCRFGRMKWRRESSVDYDRWRKGERRRNISKRASW